MDFTELCVDSSAKIKVFGVGGGGGNALNNMINSSLKGVTFVAANTDVQALNRSLADHRLQLGTKLTRGLGAGAKPEVGREATLESIDEVRQYIGDADMVFITAGMGGGTGTGSAPVIAAAAKEMGALTVGVVTKPFYFEGKRRRDQAERGIAELKSHVDSLITIPNDRLLNLASKKATFIDMLKKADEVLYHAVKGISDLMMVPGMINVDFADVKSVMSETGMALMGAGVARGEGRAREAAMKAITSPLLEDLSIEGARGVLMNITSGPDLTMDELQEAADLIHEACHEEVNLIFGAVFDMDAGDEMRITVIATGIDTGLDEKVENHLQGLTPVTQLRSSNVTKFAPPRGGNGGRPAVTPTARLEPAKPEPAQTIAQQRRRPVSGVDEDEWQIPAYIRRQKQDAETSFLSAPAKAVNTHKPGEDDFVFDEDEFEIPSFIRKQAD